MQREAAQSTWCRCTRPCGCGLCLCVCAGTSSSSASLLAVWPVTWQRQVSFLMDREKPGVTKSQPGFVDFVVRPLFDTWVACFPDCKVSVLLCSSLTAPSGFARFDSMLHAQGRWQPSIRALLPGRAVYKGAGKLLRAGRAGSRQPAATEVDAWRPGGLLTCFSCAGCARESRGQLPLLEVQRGQTCRRGRGQRGQRGQAVG